MNKAVIFLICLINLFKLGFVYAETENDFLISKDKQEIINKIIQKLNKNYLYPNVSEKTTFFLKNKISNHGYDSDTRGRMEEMTKMVVLR